MGQCKRFICVESMLLSEIYKILNNKYKTQWVSIKPEHKQYGMETQKVMMVVVYEQLKNSPTIKINNLKLKVYLYSIRYEDKCKELSKKIKNKTPLQ